MAHRDSTTLRRSTVGEASKRGLFHSGETMAGAEMNLWVSPDGAAFVANKLFIFDWEALAHPRGQTKKEVHLLPGVVDTLSLLSQWQHAAHGGSGPGMCVLRVSSGREKRERLTLSSHYICYGRHYKLTAVHVDLNASLQLNL